MTQGVNISALCALKASFQIFEWECIIPLAVSCQTSSMKQSFNMAERPLKINREWQYRTDRLYSLRATPFARWHLVLCIALRCARGAICARLADASIDSLALDYVACGSNRSVLDSRPRPLRQQKEATARVASFCWWSLLNEIRTNYGN